MTGNSIGKIFRVTNWGESHGKAIGVVVDGCPPLLELSEEDIQKDLDRRRPNQSEVTTSRNEADKVEILSGIYDGKTTGTPISMIIFNKDCKKEHYDEIRHTFRPSHADYAYQAKYGIRDPFGGGRSSARMTAGNVAAGAIARKVLRERCGMEITAYVKRVGNVCAREFDNDIEASIVRCPDKEASGRMERLIEEAKEKGDSVGGVIECVVSNVPAGLGEPIFDKLQAGLARAMMSINAAKGFEIGSGFEAAKMTGSEHNDPFTIENGKIITKTNNSGGVQGGISNGMPIIFRVAFKPTPTICKEQETVDLYGQKVMMQAKGRHDPCVAIRAVPIVEAMAALALCDYYLLFNAQCGRKDGK